MFLLPLFLFSLAYSSLLAHYQFWADTGQHILDHSGNNYHAVNGLTAGIDNQDGVLTARGAYFAGGKSASILLHSSTGIGVPLGTDFSVSAWVLPFSVFGRIYEKWDGVISKFMYRIVSFSSNRIVLHVYLSQGSTGVNAYGTVEFDNEQWMLLSVRVSCRSYCSVIGYKNYETVLNYVSPGFAYTDDLTMPSMMGTNAYQGFIYELKVYNHLIGMMEINSEFELPGYNGCPGSCSSLCVKTPYVGCISACPYTRSVDSCSAVCQCDSSKCIGNCRMTAVSCSVAGCGPSVCFDVQSHDLCDVSCQACWGPSNNQCLSCYDSNAVVLSGMCVCKTGFYARTGSGCLQCHSTCERCDGVTEHDCLSCKNHAVANSARQCVCEKGYFPEPDSANCQVCDSLCEECSVSGPSGCTKCISSSYLSGAPPSKCLCATGYFLDSFLCTQCNDSCSTCVDFSQCLSCKRNAVLIDGGCKCTTGFYREASDCIPCAEKCTECTEFSCSHCSDGSVAMRQTCVDYCPFGFRLDTQRKICEEGDTTPPVPSLSVSSNNELIVSFDKPMNISLSSTDISVEVSDFTYRVSPVSWSDPLPKDSQTIIISLTFESTWLPSNCNVQLTFLSPGKVTDEFQIPILTLVLNATLNPFGSDPNTVESPPLLLQGETAKQAAATSKAGVSAGVATSLINGSPSSLMSLINQLQIISYVAMTKIPLSMEFAQTLAALNVGSMMPNPLSKYIDVEASSQTAPQHVQNYGIDSTLFVRNSYSFLGTCGAIMASILPIFLLSKMKIALVSDYFTGLLPSFKWGIPMRLWLTSYLDLGVFALLQLSNISGENVFVVFNVTFAFAAVILFVLTPIFLIVFLYRYSALIQSASDSSFSARWGVLFQGFKCTSKIGVCAYYPLFIVRRLMLAVTLTFASDLILFSALLNTIITFTVVLYLIWYRPYDSKLDLIESIAVEGGTLLVYASATSFAFGLSPYMESVIGDFGVWAIRCTIAVNVILSLVRSVITVIVLLKLYKTRMKMIHAKYKVHEADNTTNVELH